METLRRTLDRARLVIYRELEVIEPFAELLLTLCDVVGSLLE